MDCRLKQELRDSTFDFVFNWFLIEIETDLIALEGPNLFALFAFVCFVKTERLGRTDCDGVAKF